jgi:hypothetical protein
VDHRDFPIAPGTDSRLFLIRIWTEDLGGGQSEWRAFVRRVPGGESRYVRTWEDLERFLKRFAGPSGADEPAGR